MSQSGKQVVIIGGGVVGTTVAHYLNQAGYPVTVVDRGSIGGACSHGNCGLVTPSHVLPLAEPGVLQQGIKAMLNPFGPLRINPGFDVTRWKWLMKFARRCNEHDMLQSAAAIHALLQSSRSLYDQLIQELSIQCEWQPRGVLFVFKTAKQFEAYEETDHLQSSHFDVSAKRMTANEVAEFEPALKPGMAGGWYYQRDAFMRPDQLMQSWKSILTQRGVRFVEHAQVKGLVGSTSGVTAVKTDREEIRAEMVLVCTGAWTPELQSELGTQIPIQPGKGYSLTMSRPEISPRVAMLLPEHRVAVTPMESGYRLGSIMEIAGYDSSIRESRLRLLTEGAKVYLRDPLGVEVQEKWYGWRPMTYDSVPIIDRAPRWNNVWIAAGHNMLGLSMAPATGKLMCELITGQPPHLDPQPYRVSRFQ